jgi:inosine/xanthosine triphosphatase
MIESSPQKIAVGSRNPVKRRAVERAFGRAFPHTVWQACDVDVHSGVNDQPQGDHEATTGALNRAQAALAAVPDASFSVGIEGAVHDTPAGMEAFAWIVVLTDQLIGKGRTATFYLPDGVAQRVRDGAELGAAVDFWFKTVDAKRREGAIGLLTAGALDRTELYVQGILAALIPMMPTTPRPSDGGRSALRAHALRH